LGRIEPTKKFLQSHEKLKLGTLELPKGLHPLVLVAQLEEGEEMLTVKMVLRLKKKRKREG